MASLRVQVLEVVLRVGVYGLIAICVGGSRVFQFARFGLFRA